MEQAASLAAGDDAGARRALARRHASQLTQRNLAGRRRVAVGRRAVDVRALARARARALALAEWTRPRRVRLAHLERQLRTAQRALPRPRLLRAEQRTEREDRHANVTAHLHILEIKNGRLVARAPRASRRTRQRRAPRHAKQLGAARGRACRRAGNARRYQRRRARAQCMPLLYSAQRVGSRTVAPTTALAPAAIADPAPVA